MKCNLMPKYKYFAAILPMAFLLLFMPPAIFAQSCSDLNLTSSADPVCGNNFFVILDTVNSYIPDYWGNFTNATLGIPSGIQNSSGLLFANLSNETSYIIWNLSCSSPRTYAVNVSAWNGSETCGANLSIAPRPPSAPNVTISAPSGNTIAVLAAAPFNVTLNNTGNGTAKSIITAIIMQNTTVSPASKSQSSLANGTSAVQEFSITPQMCGNFSPNIKSNYSNEANQQQPESSSIVSLVVIGPYLAVSSPSFSNPAPQEQSAIIIYSTINNSDDSTHSGCNYNISNNFTVSFYNGNPSGGGTLIQAKTLSPLSSGNEINASVSWTVPSAGAFTIYAVVSLSEPSFNSSYSSNSSITASAIHSQQPSATTATTSSGAGYYSQVCGNNVCESFENNTNCPKDCEKETTRPVVPAACNENWSCGEWSACGAETLLHARACTDSNRCNTTSQKPPESESCIPKIALDAGNAISQASSVTTDAAKAILEQARAAYDAKDYSRAIELAQLALEADKNTGTQTGTPTGFAISAVAENLLGIAAAIIIICGIYIAFKKFYKKN